MWVGRLSYSHITCSFFSWTKGCLTWGYSVQVGGRIIANWEEYPHISTEILTAEESVLHFSWVWTYQMWIYFQINELSPPSPAVVLSYLVKTLTCNVYFIYKGHSSLIHYYLPITQKTWYFTPSRNSTVHCQSCHEAPGMYKIHRLIFKNFRATGHAFKNIFYPSPSCSHKTSLLNVIAGCNVIIKGISKLTSQLSKKKWIINLKVR